LAKEIKGWRNKREWEMETSKDAPAFMLALDLAFKSDDGWYCPHCQHKATLYSCHCGEGVGNEAYFELIEHANEAKINCDECGKDYYVKCFVTRRYSSCEDKEFAEEKCGS
jgi:hypothetical protein